MIQDLREDGAKDIERIDLAPLQREETIYLQTEGRRSGRSHKVPLYFTYASGNLYLLAHVYADGRPTDWYRNLEANPECVLEVEGLRLTGRALTVADPDEETNKIREMFQTKYGKEAYDIWYGRTARLLVALWVRGQEGVEPRTPSTTERQRNKQQDNREHTQEV